MKTGKLPAKYDKKLLQLATFKLTGTFAPKEAPVGFGHYKGIGQMWGMLANDVLGDCVIAAGEHETMVLSDISGPIAPFNNETAIHDYSAIAGYIPGRPDTDQGTYMADAMKYRRKTGLKDAGGYFHKIGAYLSLEPGNYLQMLQALWAFDVVSIGVAIPESAMDQFETHKPWTVVQGAQIEGGHAISIVGRATTNYIYIVTWGRRIRMSRRFYEKYNDEAYVYISTSALVNGISPEGYDLSDLSNILATL